MKRANLFAALGFFLLCGFFAGGALEALDFSIRPQAFALFPLGEDSRANFNTGGGGGLILDFDFAGLIPNPIGLGYALGAEAGFGIAPIRGGGESLKMAEAALGAGLFFFPVPRLLTRLDGAFGLYQGMRGEKGNASVWWRAGLEAGFRFSPTFTLSAVGGYRLYNDKFRDDPMYSGVYAGLSARIVLSTNSSYSGVSIETIQEEPVFPIYLSLYQSSPAARLRITNNEAAEIRRVRLSFRAGDYTSSEFDCGTLDYIPKQGKAEIPLVADFSSELLNFNENGRILGEIRIRYEFLGAERETIRSAVVQVYNRNSFRWIDPAGLAVFVSPTVPEVLEFAKYITGLSRSHLRTGLNRNMQFAISLYEGLTAAGIRYSAETETPYRKFHLDSSLPDTVQFPFQTLAYRSGDMDDLGILYAAVLEASGIKTAFIPLEDEFVVAFSPGIREEQAGTYFNGDDGLLFIDGEVWIPVGLSSFNNGFIISWDTAAARVQDAIEKGEAVDLCILQDAWAVYPPVSLPPQRVQFSQPDETTVVRGADTNINRYIEREFEPKISELVNLIEKEGASGNRYNQLGLLYLRSGKMSEAVDNYRRAAEMNYLAAMINLANIAIREKDWEEAGRWYEQILAIDPEHQSLENLRQRIAAGREE
jgi:tetratricopeptide (TPR) repeat protein